jgi:hypothetical protein
MHLKQEVFFKKILGLVKADLFAYRILGNMEIES